jgi:hypothetical protein
MRVKRGIEKEKPEKENLKDKIQAHNAVSLGLDFPTKRHLLMDHR